MTGREEAYLKKVFANQKLSGDGEFTKKCHAWFESTFGCKKALLTTSCTHALEMAAILIDVQPGDEIIMPSFNFSSDANAFVLRGAKIVFVDIRPDTMNLDEKLVEEAITDRTKAIVPIHYAGVSCELDTFVEIARKYNIFLIEDAAQAVMSKYKNRFLGTIGHLGCYSFHETKNYNCGEGGAILFNNQDLASRGEIIREKGTNRAQFFRGQVDKYSWIDVGSSYLPSELNAAFLFAQLEIADEINRDRLRSWSLFLELLTPLREKERIDLPVVPAECEHNAHLFFIKVRDLAERTRLIEFLAEGGVSSVFHYVPLHSSKAGVRFGRFHGDDRYTTSESERLLRLPMYYGLKSEDIERTVFLVEKFFER